MTPTLKQPTGPAHTRIYSYGAARGELSVPNDDLIGPIDSSDEWIRQRTGIITRTRAVAETDAIDLATDAAAEAIATRRHRSGAHRPRHRGHGEQPEADAFRVGDRRRPCRRQSRRRVRRQRRVRGVCLRRRPGRRADPRRSGAVRARHRHREALRHRRSQPTAASPSCSATVRARPSSGRASIRASPRPCGAPTARRPTRWA